MSETKLRYFKLSLRRFRPPLSAPIIRFLAETERILNTTKNIRIDGLMFETNVSVSSVHIFIDEHLRFTKPFRTIAYVHDVCNLDLCSMELVCLGRT